jgi:hypothetical protein
MVLRLADKRVPTSLASKMRLKRNLRFREVISDLPRPLRILDVGGTQAVWETIGFAGRGDVFITLLNLEPQRPSYHNIVSVIGDARNMHFFADDEFDVVYSNSVIEHLGKIDDMKRTAREIRRVSNRYFLQTPYRYFPIEPHFTFPLFQFLPISWRVFLVMNLSIGWCGLVVPNRMLAEGIVRSIRLLSKRELRSFFPDANIVSEKFFGMTKSLLAIKIRCDEEA